MKSEKITEQTEGPARRRYEDACAAAHAMDLVGERWALFVMRELMLGPLRFTDLRARLPGLSANVLTQRLEGLEAAGIVRRRRLPPPAAAQVYELTAWGLEAEPIFVALGRWAARSPAHDPTLPFSAASLLLSLRTMFDPERGAGLDLALGIRLPEAGLVGQVSGARLSIAPGEIPDTVDLAFNGNARGVAAFIYGGVPAEVLAGDGLLRIEGDPALAAAFAACFPLPDKAEAPPAG
ncbi:winged helix-turn-helix transcriptional regulator [Antarcticirhabdus aurantiaca]|uniref:Helix-turn-helix domain-containing protein n=1 Tax=Antarcticirhabdus aurantiaca TaxID=2606717 RepID=A0ACD4NLQ9_9HYPH|nr:helix-turn-helix domain-containing protein [Antarcticirhabdus aurantiaca]WAJ27724.1 helix-turn-helix domain-containing protein [Jeongeuplla avenae]